MLRLAEGYGRGYPGTITPLGGGGLRPRLAANAGEECPGLAVGFTCRRF